MDISLGAEWEEEINKHLSTAHVILLLISPDFIASEYCYNKEMGRQWSDMNMEKRVSSQSFFVQPFGRGPH
jgi:hypothetical protein